MLIRPGQSGCDAFAGVTRDNDTSSQSDARSNQEDKRNAIGGSGLLAGQGSTINFSIANPDGFAQLLTAGVGLFEANLDFAEQSLGRAHDAIAESGRSEEQQFGLQALKAAGPILLIVGIAGAMLMSKK